MLKFATAFLCLLVSADAAKSGCKDVKPDFCELKNSGNPDASELLFPSLPRKKTNDGFADNFAIFTSDDRVAVFCSPRGPVGSVKFTYNGKMVTDRQSPYSMKENPAAKGDVILRNHVPYLTSNGGGIKKFFVEVFAKDGTRCFKENYEIEMQQQKVLPNSCGTFVRCGVSTEFTLDDFIKFNDKSVTKLDKFQPTVLSCFTKGGIGRVDYTYTAGGKTFNDSLKSLFKNDGQWSVTFPVPISPFDPAVPGYCGRVKIVAKGSNRGKSCFGKSFEIDIKCKNGQKPGVIKD